jgi:hypothetical protein
MGFRRPECQRSRGPPIVPQPAGSATLPAKACAAAKPANAIAINQEPLMAPRGHVLSATLHSSIAGYARAKGGCEVKADRLSSCSGRYRILRFFSEVDSRRGITHRAREKNQT